MAGGETHGLHVGGRKVVAVYPFAGSTASWSLRKIVTPASLVEWGMVIPCSFRCATIAFLLALVTSAHAGPTFGGCPVFPANNYWNTPVDGLPVHPSSATWVNSIGASANLHPDWGNVLADNYGIPFATVSGSQPTVPITFDPDGYGDESDPGPFPIPPNAPIEGGSSSDGDRHVLVVDTTNCLLYELYYAFPVGGGTSWSVYSSAKFDLQSNALRPADWTSADAAGFAIFPGLVRWDEVAAGEIAHAIRFTASRIWGSSGGRGRCTRRRGRFATDPRGRRNVPSHPLTIWRSTRG